MARSSGTGRSTVRPKADEDYYEDTPVALSGHVSTAGDEPAYDLDDMLLDAIGLIQKVDTLLHEAPPAAFDRNETRLERLRRMVKTLPLESEQDEDEPRQIGFVVPKRKRVTR